VAALSGQLTALTDHIKRNVSIQPKEQRTVLKTEVITATPEHTTKLYELIVKLDNLDTYINSKIKRLNEKLEAVQKKFKDIGKLDLTQKTRMVEA